MKPRKVILVIVSVLLILSIQFMLTIGGGFLLLSKILNREYQYSKYPNAQPMSDWESDYMVPSSTAKVYLHVLDRQSGILTYNDSPTEETYYVKFIPGAVMELYENDPQDPNNDGIEPIVSYSMVAYSETKCKLSCGDAQTDFPETIRLQRTSVDLDS